LQYYPIKCKGDIVERLKFENRRENKAMRNVIRVPIERTCKMCGVVYESEAPHSCYCSDTCRREYETAYARKWRDKNREKIRAYQREQQRQRYRRLHGKEIQEPQG
jgi:hypothetical protein